jgi:hypothetical protein
MWRYPQALRLFTDTNSAYSSLATAIVAPTLQVLFFTIGGFDILTYAPLWPLAGALAATYTLVLLVGSRTALAHRESLASLLAGVVAVAALYGVTGVLTYNCEFDDTEPTLYRVPVLGKYTSSGKNKTYYHLELGSWGPRAADESANVSHRCYDAVKPGDSVNVYRQAGQLGVPWFVVTDQ